MSAARSILGHSLGCRPVTLDGSTHYGTERGLDGWYILTALTDTAYVHPFKGKGDWLYTQEGIPIPAGTSRALYLIHEDLGCYSASGEIRIEEIEPVQGVEFAGPIQGTVVVPRGT